MDKRRVRIELRSGGYIVLYVSRNKYGRYSVAQFYAKDYTLRDVQDWVSRQPNLVLCASS